jgi:hypothetical protein
MNDVQKERNVGPSLLQSLGWTMLIQPMQHVYRRWKQVTGALRTGDDGLRASMLNEVDVLVAKLVELVGTDLETRTENNTMWYTGNPVNMRAAANMKYGRPFEWIWAVASGRSTCLRKGSDQSDQNRHTETWATWATRHIREHMFFQ